MPLYITPGLQFSERYVNNSLHPFDTPSEEYISYLTASLKLSYQFYQGHLESNISLESTYSNLSYLSSRFNGNQMGDLDYLYKGQRWSTGIKGLLLSTRYGDSVAQFNGGILTPQTEYIQYSAGTVGSYLLTRQLTFSMSYTYVSNEYSLATYVNSESHAASSSLTYQFRSADQLTFSAGADEFRYKPGATEQATFANLRLDHRIGETTLLQLGTGAGVTSGHTLFWLFDLNSNTTSQRGTFQIDIGRNFGTGGGFAGTSVINQQISINATKPLSVDLSENITGNYGTSDSVIPGANYHAEFWNVTLAFNYILTKWMGSSISYAHYEQRTVGSSVNRLYSNQVLLTFSSSFTPWRPF